MSFGTSANPDSDITYWRANISANPAVAADQFAAAQTRLQSSQQALDLVEKRLHNLVSMRNPAARIVLGGAWLASPEQAVLQLIDELAVDHLGISFGGTDQIREGWERANAQFRAFVERINRQIAHYAWVETRIEGQLVGRTIIDWSSDMRTVWATGVGSAQIAMHQQTLDLALSSREMLLRSFVLATRGAVILSVLLTVPGGIMMALPATLKFINDVMAELTPGNEHEKVQ
ncbi:MAG: hypothetical protein MI924_06305 [Chloroflexales bacterium]|nr:hypothetical protein [Chloroflexales bacterium]